MTSSVARSPAHTRARDSRRDREGSIRAMKCNNFGRFESQSSRARIGARAIARAGIAHGTKRNAGRRGWAGVRRLVRGMCSGSGLGTASQGAFANSEINGVQFIDDSYNAIPIR